MLPMWNLTVRSVMTNSAAISAFSLPWAISRSTSCSRSVRGLSSAAVLSPTARQATLAARRSVREFTDEELTLYEPLYLIPIGHPR